MAYKQVDKNNINYKIAEWFFDCWVKDELYFQKFLKKRVTQLQLVTISAYPYLIQCGMVPIEKRTKQEQDELTTEAEKWSNNLVRANHLKRMLAVIIFISELKNNE